MHRMRVPFPVDGEDQYCDSCGRLLIEFHGDGTMSVADHMGVKGTLEGDGDDIIGGAVEGICFRCHPEERASDLPAPIRKMIESIMRGGIKDGGEDVDDGRIELPWAKPKPRPEPKEEPQEAMDLSADDVDESKLTPLDLAMREIIRHRVDPFRHITPVLQQMSVMEAAMFFAHYETARLMEGHRPPVGAHMAADVALGAWLAGFRPEGWPDEFPDQGEFVSQAHDDARKQMLEEAEQIKAEADGRDEKERPDGGEQNT